MSRKNELKNEELIKKIKKLAELSIEIVSGLPENYRRDAFVETYRYLLSLSITPEPVNELVSSSTKEVKIRGVGVSTQRSGSLERVSLREFINMLEPRPKTSVEWITAFAYYMKYYENKHTFSSKEIKEYFKAAGEPIPSNIPRDLKNALRRGYIALDRESKSYYITRLGEEFIRGKMSEEG